MMQHHKYFVTIYPTMNLVIFLKRKPTELLMIPLRWLQGPVHLFRFRCIVNVFYILVNSLLFANHDHNTIFMTAIFPIIIIVTKYEI